MTNSRATGTDSWTPSRRPRRSPKRWELRTIVFWTAIRNSGSAGRVAGHCLVGVVTKEVDGTAGLQKDSAFDALQEEIKGIAHIILSALPSDREFWLGRKAGFNRDVIERMYWGLKPCLHGSDAHEVS